MSGSPILSRRVMRGLIREEISHETTFGWHGSRMLLAEVHLHLDRSLHGIVVGTW